VEFDEVVSVPTTEPAVLNAGDLWEWTREFSDYPSPTWTLSYYFRHPEFEGVKTFDATADGDGGHSISVAATDTAQYVGGRWSWIARVASGSSVYTVDRGTVEVRADFADEANDFRTYNQRCLDAIEAVRENRANTDQASWAIEGRSVSRMSPDELERQWHKFRDLVFAEQGIKVGHVKVRMR
jgi:hypothetical protein